MKDAPQGGEPVKEGDAAETSLEGLDIQGISELLERQHLLAVEFQEVMERLTTHPVYSWGHMQESEIVESLRRTQEATQEMLAAYKHMGEQARDVVARLEANIRFVRHFLEELDEFEHSSKFRKKQ
ncbi:hypothetical protein [Deinococcus hohokamensis]|uniref:Uncharacterized protein n=1 Tax=Deinococcus hohokamensis TaxID=309883 RepID=A0ABV9I752_9DEIO